MPKSTGAKKLTRSKPKKKAAPKAASATAPKFTDREVKFMKSYVVCMNKTQAARDAGCAESNAAQQGGRMYKKAHVRETIDKLLLKIAESQEVSAAEVIAETKKIAFGNLLDYVTISPSGDAILDASKINRSNSAAIKTLKYGKYGLEITLFDKLAALDKCDKATGAFLAKNPGLKKAEQVRPILVNTNIDGSPGINVRRPDPMALLTAAEDAE